MTLVEFLAPLKGDTHQARVLAAMYYKERYEQTDALTAEQIGQALKNARVPRANKLNVADIFNKAGHYVNPNGLAGRARLWNLTDSGRDYVRKLLGLPQSDVEIEHDVGTLEALLAKVADSDVKDYLEEALKCLRVGALRATVVFTWTAVIRTLQTELLPHGGPAVTAAVQKHDPKARPVNKLDDFAYVKDSVALLAAKDLGLLDKNEKNTLEEALDLRNRCGHPGKYKPGVKKVSSFIEDVVSILFK
jgi:hypothetical protein